MASMAFYKRKVVSPNRRGPKIFSFKVKIELDKIVVFKEHIEKGNRACENEIRKKLLNFGAAFNPWIYIYTLRYLDILLSLVI